MHRHRRALLSLAALAALTGATAPAHATGACSGTDPAGCTPPPPAALRGIVWTEQCDIAYAHQGGAGPDIVTAVAVVPFATSVAITCTFDTELYGQLTVTTTTPGPVGRLAEFVVSFGPIGTSTNAGTHPSCITVGYTYSDGTSGTYSDC